MRLYLNGLQKQEDKLRQVAAARQQKELKDKEHYTFKPQISGKKAKHREGNVENYLLNYGKMIQNKHEKLR